MKNIRLIIILFTLIMAAFAVHMLLEKKERISSIKENADDFAIQNMALMDRITVKQPNGEVVVLSVDKSKETWVLNQHIPVDADQLNNFFILLHQLKVQREVSESIKDSLKQSLPQNGYEINVYGAGKVMKSYFFGGYAPDKSGNYALLKGNDQPYIVALPGYEIDLSGVFQIVPLEWKNRYLFQSSLRSIKNIKVSFPKNATMDYSISFNKKFFTVSGVSKIDSAFLGDYLSYYSRIKISKHVEDKPQAFKDSLLACKPDYILSVEDLNPKKSNEIRLYLDLKKGEKISKSSMLYGYVPAWDGIVQVKWKNFQYLILPKDAFEKKEAKKDFPF